MSNRPWFLLCLLLALFSYTSAQDCTGPSSCVSCVATQGCGWCENTEECLPGDIQGPGGNPANCTDWQFEICLPEECRSLSGLGCEKCNRDPFCGWCESSQSCVFGDHNGPIVFQLPNPTGDGISNCSSSDYFFTSCPNVREPTATLSNSVEPEVPLLESTRRPRPPTPVKPPRTGRVPVTGRVPPGQRVPAPIIIVNPPQPQRPVRAPGLPRPPKALRPPKAPRLPKFKAPKLPKPPKIPKFRIPKAPKPGKLPRVAAVKPAKIPQFPVIPANRAPAPRLLPLLAATAQQQKVDLKKQTKGTGTTGTGKGKGKGKGTGNKENNDNNKNKNEDNNKNKNDNNKKSNNDNKNGSGRRNGQHEGNAPPPRHAFVSSGAFSFAPQVWTWGVAALFAVSLPLLGSYIF